MTCSMCIWAAQKPCHFVRVRLLASRRAAVPQASAAHGTFVSLGRPRQTPPAARCPNSLRGSLVVDPSESPRQQLNLRSYTTTVDIAKASDLSAYDPSRIRSFCIIAHIDHGKSTLSDRLLELTGTIPPSGSHGQKNQQVLDKLKVERERGITVKAVAVSMFHRPKENPSASFLLNLIDTPGHVDFSSEVHRSLLASQGAILLVDATQGVQAQTVAVLRAARAKGLVILPCLNKTDLPAAASELPRVEAEVRELLRMAADAEIPRISAKTGRGVERLLELIVEIFPPPSTSRTDAPARALVFDSWYDHYQGVVSLVSVAEGRIRKGDKIKSHHTGRTFEVSDCGIMHPGQISVPSGLSAGQCGWLTCAMKDASEAVLGDTFHDPKHTVPPVESFRPQQCMVFAGLYPIDSTAFTKLEDAIRRLTLNDRSVSVQRESSVALGQGFRLGFLGMLHSDVFRQRLLDEYGSEVLVTRPFVPIRSVDKKGRVKTIDNPIDFPNNKDPKASIQGVRFYEPVVEATILVPDEFLGTVMELCTDHRGIQKECTYFASSTSVSTPNALTVTPSSSNLVKLEYTLPLSEIVTTFHSSLKSITSGYASFDYYSLANEDHSSDSAVDANDQPGYAVSDLVRLDIIVNKTSVDAFACVVHRTKAVAEARAVLKRLKEVTPRQQFEIALQASAAGKVIASERITAVRKDVTAGLYGGHYERKMKHLQKQKEGKKRLRAMSIGNVQLPQEAFTAVLSMDGGGGKRGK